ncbi:hypothetical protein OBJ93_11365, partial [Empedobacter falsenii]
MMKFYWKLIQIKKTASNFNIETASLVINNKFSSTILGSVTFSKGSSSMARFVEKIASSFQFHIPMYIDFKLFSASEFYSTVYFRSMRSQLNK